MSLRQTLITLVILLVSFPSNVYSSSPPNPDKTYTVVTVVEGNVAVFEYPAEKYLDLKPDDIGRGTFIKMENVDKALVRIDVGPQLSFGGVWSALAC